MNADKLVGTTGIAGLLAIIPRPETAFQFGCTWGVCAVKYPASLVNADMLTGTTGIVGLFNILLAPVKLFQSAATWSGKVLVINGESGSE